MAIEAGKSGTCPHCRTGVRFEKVMVQQMGTQQALLDFNTPSNHWVSLCICACPACGRPILFATKTMDPSGQPTPVNSLLWPDATERILPPEVEKESPDIATDFQEAALVFAKSKKASAALSRRCLQAVLVTKAGAKKKDNLSDQIEEVLPSLPTQLALNVDAIRQVGNFAAHPMKSTATGMVIEVEEDEAEWLLDVLEELFDFFFVAPAAAAVKRDALNKKLEDLGKPPLKAP